MTNRRSFIRWGFFGLVLSRLFPRSSSAFAKSKWYEIGTETQLNAQKYLLKKNLEIGSVLVTKKDQSIMAVDPTCPHERCTVKWKSNNALVCPCHGSKFQQDGTRIRGIASSNLSKYQVKVESGKVLVAKA